MINYIEKGIGLHREIEKYGLALRQENGQWVTDDEQAVQAIIDSYTLDKAKAIKQAEILAFAKMLRDTAIRAISAGEMASWPVKLAEAQSYNADQNAAKCPMLSAEAAARGIDVASLVAKVNNNAGGFAMLEATISGVDGRHRDAVKACQTFAEIADYDYFSGWPAV